MSEEVHININNNLNFSNDSFKEVIGIQNSCIKSEQSRIKIKFPKCKFISPVFLPIIGSLPEVGKKYNKEIDIDISSINDYKLKSYMASSGFINYLNPEIAIDLSNSNAINFKKFIPNKCSDEEIYNYIQNILTLAPIGMDEEVTSEFLSKLYELFDNAFTHSKTKIGVFSCGHFLPNKEKLFFSIYDVGIGIPVNVKNYLNDKNLSSSDALKWAIQKGNSTVENRDYARGLGLDFLKDIVRLNKGQMRIYSNDSMCKITGDFDEYETIESELIGTIISLIINADHESIYIMKK